MNLEKSLSTEDIKPISVEFPLRGEWMALTTPGTKIPSHGTDAFGQTYAYDFIGVDPGQKSPKVFKKSNLDYLLGRSNLSDFTAGANPFLHLFQVQLLKQVMDIQSVNPICSMIF